MTTSWANDMWTAPVVPVPKGDPTGCRVYWGSHGCDKPRGHDGDHACGCATDPEEYGDDGPNEVGAPPYYGPDTRFYGEDAEALGLPLVMPPDAWPSADR